MNTLTDPTKSGNPVISASEMRAEVARMGEQIYEQTLRSTLEPGRNGQLVAIHIPSQEYFLGDSILDATYHLREKHPHAGRSEVYTRGVGQRAVIRAHTPRVSSGKAE